MVITIKKGSIKLSHWIENGYDGSWIKHRLVDYSEPIDYIKLIRRLGYDNWTLIFYGPNIKYIEDTYNNTYGIRSITTDQVEATKRQIDKFLTKIDKLLIFA